MWMSAAWTSVQAGEATEIRAETVRLVRLFPQSKGNLREIDRPFVGPNCGV